MTQKRPDLETLSETLTKTREKDFQGGLLDGQPKHAQLLQVPINSIVPNPDQPRKKFNEVSIRELADSIQHKGIIEPLVARSLPNNTFELIAGERRLRALRLLDRATAPVFINQSKDTMELALIENIQREDLNSIELAEALHKLKVVHAYTEETLGKILGKSQAWVNETLALNRLSQDLKQKAIEKKINRSALIEIVRGKMSLDNVLEGKNTPTVRGLRELRNQKKSADAPIKHRLFYRSEEGKFNVTLLFDKAKASKNEIRTALQEAAVSLGSK